MTHDARYTTTDDLLLTGDVARLLGCSPDWVRHLVRVGDLPAERTPSGCRVIRRGDVLRLLERRARGANHA